MLRPRLCLATSLAVAYFVLAGLLPILGTYHDLAIGEDATHHQAIDTCTWVQHTIGSSAVSCADTDLLVLASNFSSPPAPAQLHLLIQPDSLQARAPPAVLS